MWFQPHRGVLSLHLTPDVYTEGPLQGAIAANDKYICNISDPTQHRCLTPLTSTAGSAVSSYITWLWAISAQMVWLAAGLAASSARLQHHQVALSSVFFFF